MVSSSDKQEILDYFYGKIHTTDALTNCMIEEEAPKQKSQKQQKPVVINKDINPVERKRIQNCLQVIGNLQKATKQDSSGRELYQKDGCDFSFALSYFNFMNNDPSLNRKDAHQSNQKSIITERKVIRNRLEEILSMQI